jgi:hypothetical protein
MAGHGEKLGRKTEEVIAALLSQRNVEEAARVAKVGARTLYRWMQEPEFDAAFAARGGMRLDKLSRDYSRHLAPQPRCCLKSSWMPVRQYLLECGLRRLCLINRRWRSNWKTLMHASRSWSAPRRL